MRLSTLIAGIALAIGLAPPLSADISYGRLRLETGTVEVELWEPGDEGKNGYGSLATRLDRDDLELLLDRGADEAELGFELGRRDYRVRARVAAISEETGRVEWRFLDEVEERKVSRVIKRAP